MENNNGIINQNNGSDAGQQLPKEKAGFKGLLDKAHRTYDAIRYSKAGKWGARVLTLLTIGGTAKYAYDKGVVKGKGSVTPTVVTIEKIQEEAPAEAPAEEESAVEES